ncbi:MAG: S8 family serine peptidase, partial [Pseudomonadota bacterium]
MTPSDNLYRSQYYLFRIGDLERIWDDYNGSGVNVAVIDDGVEFRHHDLNNNYNASLHVRINGQAVVPNPGGPNDGHGTAVAGIIGSERNGSGTVGVAWNSNLTGVNIFDGPASTPTGFNTALEQLDRFDVTNNSWGYDAPFALGNNVLFQAGLFEDSLETGRNGLGTINVKAAGNSNNNANGEQIEASRATVSVAAYTNQDQAAGYSNYGANILVSAPSNGGTVAQTTTDLTGSAGYSAGDYTNSFGGTSGASPVVAGVVALMLDANSRLGWRDVQEIIANSSHEVGSGVGGTPRISENHNWFYNGDN